MGLPQFQTTDRDLNLLQSRWTSILNPLLGNPSLQSQILPNVSLIMGVTVVNHKLGAALRGWRIIRLRAEALVWDSQDSNQTPQLTLILNSSGPVVVDLEVF